MWHNGTRWLNHDSAAEDAADGRLMRTQVGIVGAGPAGLTLALLLEAHGIESVIVENRSRAYVEARVRAGLLEHNTVEVMREVGVATRLSEEGLVHDGIHLRFKGRTIDIALAELTGRHVTVYGQQEVVKDMIGERLRRGGPLLFEAEQVSIHDLEGSRPRIDFRHDGSVHSLQCDVIAGCDGFHGVSRAAIPDKILCEQEHVYDFGWLGILAEAAPATDELIYGWHERGFALYSMRSPRISRLYIQVPADEILDRWPDDRIWEELQVRLAADGFAVSEGRILERSIAPLRSYVATPMQHGRLFLAGDAAHIVPPAGAKGLNLAVNDVRLLADALAQWYSSGSSAALDAYTQNALRRVWRAQDFSNYMTSLLHDLGGGEFERGLQLARLEYLSRSEAAARSLAENYVGMPARPDF